MPQGQFVFLSKVYSLDVMYITRVVKGVQITAAENKTVLSRLTINEKQRHIENHGSRRNKHLFLVSRKTI